jgi:hypothetical protein
MDGCDEANTQFLKQFSEMHLRQFLHSKWSIVHLS